MRSASIVIEGLCLWLTSGSGGVRAVIPDFAMAIPAHVATLSVPVQQIQGADGQCPAPFKTAGTTCQYPLNGMGNDGGVQISLTSEAAATTPLETTICTIPNIQHDVPLTLRSDYSPPFGSHLAAQMLLTTGRLQSPSPGNTCADCPRFASYTLDAGGPISLTLTNLRAGAPVVVPLVDGAQVMVRNKRSPTMTGDDTADWCLYFTMFERVGCPGAPKPPACPASPATQPAPAHGHSYKFETIACSNSQYP